MLACTPAVVTTPLSAASPEEIQKAAADVTASLEVQSKLPTDNPRAEDGTPPPRVLGSGGRSMQSVEPPAEMWSVIGWPIIGFAAVALAVLLASWLIEVLPRWPRPPSNLPVQPHAGVAAPRTGPDQLLSLADEWAASGRYGEAMHQVLLAAVAMLGGRLGSAAPDSLTSWELLRAASLLPSQQQALRSLVTRVELVWFGKRAAVGEDYQAVRASFQVFSSGATP